MIIILSKFGAIKHFDSMLTFAAVLFRRKTYRNVAAALQHVEESWGRAPRTSAPRSQKSIIKSHQKLG